MRWKIIENTINVIPAEFLSGNLVGATLCDCPIIAALHAMSLADARFNPAKLKAPLGCKRRSKMDKKEIEQIRKDMEAKSTEELQKILSDNDRERYYDETFEVVRQLLLEREGKQ